MLRRYGELFFLCSSALFLRRGRGCPYSRSSAGPLAGAPASFPTAHNHAAELTNRRSIVRSFPIASGKSNETKLSVSQFQEGSDPSRASPCIIFMQDKGKVAEMPPTAAGKAHRKYVCVGGISATHVEV